MKIKHSKYKNTGILFELLVRQIASDTVSGKDSAAIGIVKKFFNKRIKIDNIGPLTEDWSFIHQK